ncbi:MAG: glycosyl hydrolase 108 family protein [Halodesulfovibrio sp.]|uniref:glycosyl hydrolase 108 family protein n=1 Tax=Halodesulfovibrio sp. TaxID=1912772 RepID=UPI00359E2FD1
MSYYFERFEQLSRDNATLIEANLDAVTKAELQRVLPTGRTLQSIQNDLQRGELFLLSASPDTPLFSEVAGELTVNNSHAITLSSEAITHAENRLVISSPEFLSSAVCDSSDSLPPATEPESVPQEVATVTRTEPEKNYSYHLEIVCPSDKSAKYAPGLFNLAELRGEDTRLVLKQDTSVTNTVWLSTKATSEKKRKLYYKPQSGNGGGSNLFACDVNLFEEKPSKANEALIPVTPAVQVGKRLGFSTKGYFYHFHNGELVQEFMVKKGAKSFSLTLTRSRSDLLTDDVVVNKPHQHILLYMRLHGAEVGGQHILYKKEKLTAEELALAKDASWLNTHGVSIDVGALQAARKATVAPAQVEPWDYLPANTPQLIDRVENVSYDYPLTQITKDVLAAKTDLFDMDIPVVNVAQHPDSLFRKYFYKILGHEGGFSDEEHDSGGKTNKGITIFTYRSYAQKLFKIEPTVEHLKKITDEQAYLIAKTYWDSVRADEINDPELAYLLVDFKFNSGQAVRVLQETLVSMGASIQADGVFGSRTLRVLNSFDSKEVYINYREARKNFYRNRCESDPTQKRFLNGWLNRCATFTYY